jgi:hypothetical protein
MDTSAADRGGGVNVLVGVYANDDVHGVAQTRQAMLTPSGKNEFDRRLGNFRVQIKLDGEGERLPAGCRCNLVVVNIVKILSIECIAI